MSVSLGSAPVLRGIDFAVRRGEIVAVLGINGSGKSTLLRCLAGLLSTDSGEVEVLHAQPTGDPPFWRDVALVADPPAWYPGLTVREHLELVRLTHRPVPEDVPGVDDLLDRFGLGTRVDASPLVLSTGQRQRLALATAFVRPSRLMLLDEPEQGLDAEFRLDLAGLLAEYAAGGGTVVMATHDRELAGRCWARQVTLSEGFVSTMDAQ